MKHLKKIPTCIWNFVKIHSGKEEDFFVTCLKKIPKCIRNLWISIPEKRRIFCEELKENSLVYSKFENIYSRKEGGFFMKCLKRIPKCIRNLWISIPKKRKNIMYYYYIYSLRVWGRVFFFSSPFLWPSLGDNKKRHVIHTKDFFERNPPNLPNFEERIIWNCHIL